MRHAPPIAGLAHVRVHAARRRSVIDRGIGADVLDSPAFALTHLARVLAEHAGSEPLVAGEIITTGTITDAWPVARVARRGRATTANWACTGLTLRFT